MSDAGGANFGLTRQPEEQRLPGGNAGGAVLVDGTVRRGTGPWTPAVHAVLEHLSRHGFARAPRVLGLDEQGREVLTFLPGHTVGTALPWPAWTHSDRALAEVGAWLAEYHRAVADFVPPPGAVWRSADRAWRPGDVIGHNDAAPYNAVWADEGALVGFVDWDFCGPCDPIWDLAFTAFAWVPLHARARVRLEGFTAFADRPRRLRLLLDAYGYEGTVDELLDAVHRRIDAHIAGMELAARTDPLFAGLVADGHADAMRVAQRELAEDRSTFL